MVRAAARTLARRRMGACETTPPTCAPGTARPFTATTTPIFPASDDPSPPGGLKLVRPRRCAAAGAPACPLQHGDVNQAAAKKIPEEQSGPARRHRKAAGPMTHALLTPLALMGAAWSACSASTGKMISGIVEVTSDHSPGMAQRSFAGHGRAQISPRISGRHPSTPARRASLGAQPPGTTVPVCYMTPPFLGRWSGDAGGFELGVVVVPSGAGPVASSPS